ncbi:hypothetical protein EON66_04475, partial [archaeon]
MCGLSQLHSCSATAHGLATSLQPELRILYPKNGSLLNVGKISAVHVELGNLPLPNVEYAVCCHIRTSDSNNAESRPISIHACVSGDDYTYFIPSRTGAMLTTLRLYPLWQGDQRFSVDDILANVQGKNDLVPIATNTIH